jgi:membrane-associated phospholipid phosphatase
MNRLFSRLYPSLLLYWGSLLALLYLFAELAGNVYRHERIHFDEPILTWLHSLITPPLTTLASILSFIGSVYVLAPALFLVVLGVWRVSKRSALFFMIAFGGAVALNFAAKAFFTRLRPELFAQLSPEQSFSFPSGHTMASSAFFLALYFLVRHHAPKWQWLAAFVGFSFTLGISLSRPYLQVHYPSDILVGWALSTLWVLEVNLLWYARTRRGG